MKIRSIYAGTKLDAIAHYGKSCKDNYTIFFLILILQLIFTKFNFGMQSLDFWPALIMLGTVIIFGQKYTEDHG